MKNRDKKIGTFQGIDVYVVRASGQTYMDLVGYGCFWLGVEGNAAEELAKLKTALAGAKLRTRAEVDAEIVRVLRADVLKGISYDCLAGAFNAKYDTANVLRKLCAEETQDP